MEGIDRTELGRRSILVVIHQKVGPDYFGAILTPKATYRSF